MVGELKSPRKIAGGGTCAIVEADKLKKNAIRAISLRGEKGPLKYERALRTRLKRE